MFHVPPVSAFPLTVAIYFFVPVVFWLIEILFPSVSPAITICVSFITKVIVILNEE
ncbi:MAG: hypothetical protein LBD05_02635 [Mycoplasmataceae bacterium]|nr:hypothetical protein [Mycoplasmataceae bacterium]